MFSTLILLSPLTLKKNPIPLSLKSLVVSLAVALGSLPLTQAECQNILLKLFIDSESKCKICGGQHRQWKLLPCPCIFLGLLIDRTSYSAILHWTLPGKVPLFLWETTGCDIISKCINIPQLSDHQWIYMFLCLEKVGKYVSTKTGFQLNDLLYNSLNIQHW